MAEQLLDFYRFLMYTNGVLIFPVNAPCRFRPHGVNGCFFAAAAPLFIVIAARKLSRGAVSSARTLPSRGLQPTLIQQVIAR
ncbi:MAG: hypothetical protein V9H69_03840 [Anaerolineae bacterium]